MKNNSYFDQRKIDTIEKLREIRKELPYICNEYFVGISSRTSELTQLGYAGDLKIFFHFLTTEICEFVGKSIKNFDYADLAQVTSTHIEMFLDYLTHFCIDGKEYSNSLKTKARKLASIKSFFKYNYNKDNIPSDQAAKVLTPKLVEKPIVRLENNEVEDLLEVVEDGSGLQGKQVAFHAKTA